MQHNNTLLAVLLLALGYLSPASGALQQVPVGEIKKSLVCLCDCNMTVEACEGSMACQSAEKLTGEAAGYIEQGMNQEAVLATFIKKYGEHILAAPTKRGFNLTAWVLPFAAIIVAGLGIIVVLRRWVRQQQSQETQPKLKNVGKDDKSPYAEKLDEVLHYLD